MSTILARLRQFTAAVLGVGPEAIDLQQALGQQGLDSVALTELAERISTTWEVPVNATLFFEYPTLVRVAEYLTARTAPVAQVVHSTPTPVMVAPLAAPATPMVADIAPTNDPLAAWLFGGETDTVPAQPVPTETVGGEDPVAIIGLSGRFADCDDLGEFWSALDGMRDCVREVPADRWDWRAHAGDPHTQPNTTNVRWGGFLRDIRRFDAGFFRISRREAESMDPQHRLLLEEAWRAIEDAGLKPTALAGSRTGVFVGLNGNDYQELLITSGAHLDAFSLTGTLPAIAPNRISYLLDLRGPSMPMDTGCASSFTALHTALHALRRGDCDQALVGGALLCATPRFFLSLSHAGALSPTGRCRTFDAAADGYARGEGVAMALLKPLSRALADGDPIRAVIRGSAHRHGGRGASLTAPNVDGQADLIIDAWRGAGVDPATCGYIEAHGTGTRLGDPVEINGLKKAFATLLGDQMGDQPRTTPHIALGSVKTNIGHLEPAAGMAGLAKVVLALQHGRLPGTVHFTAPNPLLGLAGSPFEIVAGSRPWAPVADANSASASAPRRAGISSFGIGGAYTHVVLEEFRDPRPVPVASAGQQVIPLSAADPARLRQAAEDLLLHLRGALAPHQPLEQIAWTLQSGREELGERVAVVAKDHAELRAGLEAYLSGSAGHWMSGNAEAGHGSSAVGLVLRGEAGARFIHDLAAGGDVEQVARLWVAGVGIEWKLLHGGLAPVRVNLPARRFAGEAYWLPKPVTPRLAASALHPLLDHNVSDLTGQRFTVTLLADALVLRDHVVMGKRMLPAMAGLEMVRAAAALSAPTRMVTAVRSIAWSRPLEMAEGQDSVEVTLEVDEVGDDVLDVRLLSRGADGELIEHQQCEVVLAEHSAAAPPRIDLLAVRARCPRQLTAAALYPDFERAGLAYGPAFRTIANLAVGTDEGVAELRLGTWGADPALIVHPTLMDGALQAALALILADAGLHLPFRFHSIAIHGALPSTCWAHLRIVARDAHSARFEVDLCDADGVVLVAVRGFEVLKVQRAGVTAPASAAPITTEVIGYRGVWQTRALTDLTAVSGNVLLLSDDAVLTRVFADVLGDRLVVVESGAGFAELTANHFRLRSASADDARALAAALSGPRPPTAIIHAWSGDDSQSGTLDDALDRTAITLLHLAQAFSATHADQPLAWASLALDERGTLASGCAGFWKTLALERSRWSGRSIRWEDAVDAALSRAVLNELAVGREREIRFQAGQRAVRVATDWSPVAPAVPAFRRGAVVLITGGAGGLGLILARHLITTCEARVVLVGRSELDPARTSALAALGDHATYVRADVTDAAALGAAVAFTRNRFGRLDVAIHTAGVLRDALLARKTAEQMREVLAPKLHGALALDAATADCELDALVLFSSINGFLGNLAQYDYAFANAWLDAFAQHREAQCLAGRRHGRTVAIDWPLWADGGMQVSAARAEEWFRTTGMVALATTAGLDALTAAVAGQDAHVGLVAGVPERIRATMARALGEVPLIPVRTVSPTSSSTPANAGDQDRAALIRELTVIAASILHLDAEHLDPSRELGAFGFDSISLTELVNRVNRRWNLDLTPTALYSHPTLGSFADFLADEHGVRGAQAAVTAAVSATSTSAGTPATTTRSRRRTRGNHADTSALAQPIAIIGFAGRLPGGDDLDDFWASLVAGHQAITEVPAERASRFFDGRPSESAYRGGFIRDIDAFDHAFFGMSPRETAYIDPQQRLVLEHAWHAIEHAGYAPSSLAGSDMGVFIGATSQDYSTAVVWPRATDAFSGLGTIDNFLPNRISYLLDARGPSETVDTACSSSLVALHRAVAALRRGECTLALAGGVNALLSHRLFDSFAQAGMLSPRGRCASFAADADGYARGEGVALFLLKPLSKAQADGDQIHGVILGSAVNHGGRASSLTAPNPQAQSEVIRRAWRDAGVDPALAGVIETHGTGTRLGDPIEVEGLRLAFAALVGETGNQARDIALHAVKSTIGHLEPAAGAAGLATLLLGMRHGRLPAIRGLTEINPLLRLEGTPFRLLRQSEAWAERRGQGWRRVAGISSFGIGGSNAHLVVAQPEAAAPRSIIPGPQVLTLSARSVEQVRVMAARLATALEREPDWSLADVAWTLQVGRDHYPQRAALVATERSAALAGLHALVHGATAPGLIVGEANSSAATPSSTDPAALAAAWVAGAPINWTEFTNGSRQRVALPGYPFARTRHWLDEPLLARGTTNATATVVETGSHPLLGSNESDFDEQRFRSVWSADHVILAHHRVAGVPTLPAMAGLELVRAAVERSVPGATAMTIRAMVWTRPVQPVETSSVTVVLGLQPNEDGRTLAASLRTRDDAGTETEHCRCEIAFAEAKAPAPAWLDLIALRAACPRLVTVDQHYARFTALGLDYGPAFRSVAALVVGDDQAVAELILPAAAPLGCGLDPALLDGALQAAQHLLGEPDVLHLPVGFGVIALHGPTPKRCVAVLRRTSATSGGACFDVTIADHDGQVLVAINGFEVMRRSQAATTVLTLAQGWTTQALTTTAMWSGPVLLVGVDEALVAAACAALPSGMVTAVATSAVATPDAARELWARLSPTPTPTPTAVVIGVADTDGFTEPLSAVEAWFSPLLHLVQGAMRSVATAPLAWASVGRSDNPAWAASAAFWKTLAAERPAWQGRAFGWDDTSSAVQRWNALAAELVAGNARAVRVSAVGREIAGVTPWSVTSAANTAEWSLPVGAVVMISGGVGGLGLLLARHLVEIRGARVVVIGRSELTDAQRAGLIALGDRAHHVRADVTNEVGAASAVTAATTAFGRLDVVVHAAGVLDDGLLESTDLERMRRVMAPKLAGAAALDRATANLDLSAFVLFSSATGLLGNAGQAAYAVANATLDAWAECREEERLAGRRHGRTVAIGWPLWAEGGMGLEPAQLEQLARAFGVTPLSTAVGLELFAAALRTDYRSVIALAGDCPRLESAVARALAIPARTAPTSSQRTSQIATRTGRAAEAAVLAELAELASAVLRIPAADLNADEELRGLGFDSIQVTELMARVNRHWSLDLSPTLLFAHPTLRAFAEHLVAEHASSVAPMADATSTEAIADLPASFATAPITPVPSAVSRRGARFRTTGVAPAPTTDDAHAIAIIGMSGRFPGSPTLDAFWSRLESGADATGEVPDERAASFFGAGGKRTGYRAGYIADLDAFDHAFFGISPREASYMDPQHRLAIQAAWHAIEDAGYRPSSLAGVSLGVFIGVCVPDYGANVVWPSEPDAYSAIGLADTFLPNRISYLLDARGPSEAVDTACSSSLVALNRAVSALRRGECSQALVGGVNALLSHRLFDSFRKAGALSDGGRCRTFSADADGYVRGEGVGMLLLKPLAQARADGDHIHGVVLGTAVNHGGHAQSLTAPNPTAQAEVIERAWRDARIEVTRAGRMETHGTGTRLGDPIEIDGLKAALTRLAPGTAVPAQIALGAAKTVIGHCEAAAGVAGVIATLLAMRHGVLPGVAVSEVNPLLRLDGSALRIPRTSEAWATKPAADGWQRVAGVSSFGLGGTNAHVVVAQPIAIGTTHGTANDDPQVIPWSAHSAEQLRTLAAALATALAGPDAPSLADCAWTLQHGRDHHPWRAAVVASSREELRQILAAFAAGRGDGVAVGQASAGESLPVSLTGPAGAAYIREAQRQHDLIALGRLWVSGVAIDWQLLHGTTAPRRVSLPGYPFALTRHWLAQPEPLLAEQLVEQTQVDEELETEDHFSAEMADDVGVFAQSEPISVAVNSPIIHDPLLRVRTCWIDRTLADGAVFSGRLLVVSDDAKLAATFTALLGERVVVVTNDQLAERLPTVVAGEALAGVVMMWRAQGVPDDQVGLDRQLVVAEQLLALAQGLIPKLGAKPLAWACVAVGADTPEPLLAGTAGFLKSLSIERPWWRSRAIAWTTSTREGLATAVLDELARGGEADIRHDGSQRRIRTVEPWLPGDRSGTTFKRDGVYLVTGGAGGIGLHLAQYLVEHHGARLVLVGRSELGAERTARLATLGGRVAYVRGDVADPQAMAAAVAFARSRFGGLDGVIHAAGTLRDGLLPSKTSADVRAVLTPKLHGTVALDQAIRDVPIGHVVLFSSLAGLLGNIGQSDYAFANGWLDAYAEDRTLRQRAGGCTGTTIAIGWPLWRDGGMHVDAEREARWAKATGMVPMETADGMRALAECVALGAPHAAVVAGDQPRIIAVMARGLGLADDAVPTLPVPVAANAPRISAPPTSTRVLDETSLGALAASILRMPAADLDPERELGAYGFDSIAVGELIGRVKSEYGVAVTPAALYANPTIRRLSAHLAPMAHQASAIAAPVPTPRSTKSAAPVGRRTARALSRALPRAVPTVDEPIAIVGMAVRLPGCLDTHDLWNRLVEGREVVGPPPIDWVGHQGGDGRGWPAHYLNDVASFDARFFGIAPREAASMDPQQRLAIAASWHAIEDAGYAPGSLAGSPLGVFVAGGSVPEFASGAGLAEQPDGTTVLGIANTFLANRVSFLLDARGPSETIDTACSSSLVALHRAVAALRAGQCSLAVVTAVNVLIATRSFAGLSRAGMLSPDGRCKSFSAKADGYGRAEGATAVLLKPLSQARRDGDHIHGVVLGVAINHGGRAQSLTAPNPEAQAAVVMEAVRASGVDPALISAVETHGTGTRLGDPVEISGLAAAFARLAQAHGGKGPRDVRLTAAKATLGHLEPASGMAGMFSLVLGMRHGRLPAIRGLTDINPLVKLDGSPLRLLQRTEAWPALADAPWLRVAGVSSFGMGGTNAHVIIAQPHPEPAPMAEAGQQLVPLSARSPEQVLVLAARVADVVERDPTLRLAEVAWTLQVGRDAHDHRLVVLASSREELIRRLRAASHGGAEQAQVVSGQRVAGQSQPLVLSGAAGRAYLREALAHRELEPLARLWVNGVPVDWRLLHEGQPPRRVALPGYPFAVTRLWPAPPSKQTVTMNGALKTTAPTVVSTVPPTTPTITPPVPHPDPCAATERLVREAWSEVLGIAEVKPDDDFFALGGHSLLATQLVERLGTQLGVTLALGELLAVPRPSAWAECIVAATGGVLPTTAVAPAAVVSAPLTASPTTNGHASTAVVVNGDPLANAECLVREAWSEVLGIAEVKADDDFFALGGHSLLATQLVERLGAQLGVTLALGELLAVPRPSAWAERIVAATGGLVPSASTEPSPTMTVPTSVAHPVAETTIAPSTAAPGSQGEAERLVCSVWAEILGIPEVKADDDFFALGGHSLLATQIVERLGGQLGVTLGLGELLAIPRPNAWAEHILAART